MIWQGTTGLAPVIASHIYAEAPGNGPPPTYPQLSTFTLCPGRLPQTPFRTNRASWATHPRHLSVLSCVVMGHGRRRTTRPRAIARTRRTSRGCAMRWRTMECFLMVLSSLKLYSTRLVWGRISPLLPRGKFWVCELCSIDEMN